MKILYIDVNCKSGSTGKIVYSLFSECKNNGIEASICYGRGKLIKEKNIYKFGIDIETILHALLTRLTGYMGKYSPLSTKRLIKYIKAYKPDIVHIHELHSYFVNIGPVLRYLCENKIKTVFTNHCEFLYTGKCGHAKDCFGYLNNCGNCPLKKEYPKSLFFDKTKQMFLEKKQIFENWNEASFVFPSNWLKSRAELSFLKNKNLSVIYNGIDVFSYKYTTDENIKNKYKMPLNKKIVLSVAPNIFSELKGGFHFISIAKNLNKYEDLIFVAVGAKEKPKDIPNNLIIIPTIENKNDLIQLYSSASCIVICSSHENFPTTSLESQCCGTKVLAFDVGGVKETIIEGNGVVVKYCDIEEMCNLIIETAYNDYSKKDVSDRAATKFSDRRMFNDYLSLYKKL